MYAYVLSISLMILGWVLLFTMYISSSTVSNY